MLEGKKIFCDTEIYVAHHMYYKPNLFNADSLALFLFSDISGHKVLVALLMKQINNSTKSVVFDGCHFHS